LTSIAARGNISDPHPECALSPMPSAAQGRSAALVALSRGAEQGQAVLGASLPRTISEAGERAAFHSVEFFTARIPNVNTRAAYGGSRCFQCNLRR
jgi:hypothetical protein